MLVTVTCPTCHKMVVWDQYSNFKPFCSERCKLIDLGEWASENHVIEGDEMHLATEKNDINF